MVSRHAKLQYLTSYTRLFPWQEIIKVKLILINSAHTYLRLTLNKQTSTAKLCWLDIAWISVWESCFFIFLSVTDHIRTLTSFLMPDNCFELKHWNVLWVAVSIISILIQFIRVKLIQVVVYIILYYKIFIKSQFNTTNPVSAFGRFYVLIINHW